MANRILIIDDEEQIRETISDILKDEGYEVLTAADGEEGYRRAVIEDIDAVILDVMLPKKGGMDVLEALHKEFVLLPVIIISGHGNIKMAVEAMKKGAFDFIEKPLSMERILSAVRNAVTMKELQMENLNLKSRLESAPAFVSSSPAMKNILDKLPQIAESTASVLITGENGSGKELIARMIHQSSPRRRQPFIGLNCAAIPETLLESELFGYEKGAFTGAARQKKGKWEQANRGTLFLDEIGDMSPSAQAKVLRALQEGEIERIGGSSPIRLDVRILAATNKNLAEEIRAGRFRQDLFYRLNVIPIQIPPLRERKDDIAPLAQSFLEEMAEKTGRRKTLSKAAAQALTQKNWPGNVRELKNFVERLFILSVDQEIGPADVLSLFYPEDPALSPYASQNLRDAREEFEKALVRARLVHFQNNISKTAESLGIERTYLHKLLKDWGE